MLKIKNIGVYIANNKILDDISFELLQGQILMVLGPNGCGKTTLVRAIMNSIKHSGDALLEGEDIKKLAPNMLAKKIAVLTQNNNVRFKFSAYDLVSVGRYSHKPGFCFGLDEKDKRAIDRAFEMTRTEHLKQRCVTTLSGGEMQRVFLARAFAQEPNILILDEPTNHLDIEHQMLIFDIIKDWVSRKNHAVLSIIHDLNMAYTYGTHAILISKGSSVAYGVPENVLTSKNLEMVYGVDLVSWMRSLLSKWRQDGE